MRLRQSDIDWASSQDRLFHADWNTNEDAALGQAMFEYRARGIGFAFKSEKPLFPGFATNLSSRRLWIPQDFWDRPLRRVVATLAHELVHFRQREQHGDFRFNSRYLFSARWRWRYEVQAYRESVRLLWVFTASPQLCGRRADHIITSLRRNYFINARRNRVTEEKTRSILLLDVPEPYRVTT